jgi:hypothetical protein
MAKKPSPKEIMRQSSLSIPAGSRVREGPTHVPLSCNPPMML